eukprot:3901114-Amphidinium_carterae.1
MRQAGCIFLPQSKKLMVLPAHIEENKIIFPTGTKTVILETSPSGHMLVPFLTKHDNARRDTNHHQHYHLHPHVADHAHVEETKSYSAVTSSVSDTSASATRKEVRFQTHTEEHSWDSHHHLDLKDKQSSQAVEIVHFATNSRERAAQRKQILNLVEAKLVDHHIRLAHTRTNIYGENSTGHSFSPSSVLYGAYTRRGKGITQETEKKLDIVETLTKLATSRPTSRRSMPFSSIQVTCSQSKEGLPAHQDAGNFGLSDIIGLGTYDGGQLWVSSSSGHERLPEKLQPIHLRLDSGSLRGTWHDIRRKWLVFDGKAWHCSRPYTGQRISVIFFNPSGIHTLLPEEHRRLQELGFLIPLRPHDEQSWLTPVDHIRTELQYPIDQHRGAEKTAIVVAERLRQLLDTLHQDGYH